VTQTLQDNPQLKARINEAAPAVPFGETALICAIHRGNLQVIDALLNAGADINQKSHWWAGGFTPLDNAIRPRELIDFLLKRGAAIDIRTAVRLGMVQKVKEILAADPQQAHARGGDGQTPLHVAPTVEIAQILLDHGADIDARDIDHESTPAQYLVRDHSDVARFLVSRGCKTDLLLAAALGDLDPVRKHLAEDPDCIRMCVNPKFFPMQNPRAGGCVYIWTLGANNTAHIVAREFGHEEVFRVLMDATPIQLKLALACELGDEQAFNLLLAQRPDLATTLSDEQKQKLPHAAQANNAPAVRLMLKAGWPVDARGQHGATALHWAAFHGNAEMAREILRYNPSLEIRDGDHNGTPLGWATHGSKNGWRRATGDYAATVEAMLAAGAKLPEDIEKVDATEPVLQVLRRFRSTGAPPVTS
jgi:ankyrin repeat protein